MYKDRWDDIGFTNNAFAWTSWQNHAYWMQHYAQINIIHYTGIKPWTCVPDAFIPRRLRPRLSSVEGHPQSVQVDVSTQIHTPNLSVARRGIRARIR